MQNTLVENLFWYFENEKSPKYYDISRVYYRIFSIYNKTALNKVLEYFYLSVYLKNKDDDEWFVNFHKMIRQNDFFENCYRREINGWESINGDLDMLLHSFIYIDENYLCNTLKFIFQEYEENK